MTELVICYALPDMVLPNVLPANMQYFQSVGKIVLNLIPLKDYQMQYELHKNACSCTMFAYVTCTCIYVGTADRKGAALHFRFAVVGWLKMFVGLARDRFDSLIQSPSATFLAHARTLALLLVIFANDVACIMVFMRNHDKAPIGHLTLWLFDTVVAGLEAAAIMVKYGECASFSPLNPIRGRMSELKIFDGMQEWGFIPTEMGILFLHPLRSV